jgi:hypothetical protein
MVQMIDAQKRISSEGLKLPNVSHQDEQRKLNQTPNLMMSKTVNTGKIDKL